MVTQTESRSLAVLQNRRQELRSGEPLAAFARTIGVAPKAVLEMMRGDAGAGDQSNATGKALAGRAESIGRIVDFANQGTPAKMIDPVEVLKELGFDVEDYNVRRGLSRRQAIVRARQEISTHGDPVIERILFGDGPARAPNVVHAAAVAPQFPFCPDEKEIERSFSGKFLRRLLNCLQPAKWEIPPLLTLSYSELFDIDKLRDGEIDVAFGLFDTPSRRLDGFDFIHLPGLGSPLICLSFGVDGFGWAELLDSDMDRPEEFDIVVIRGEVGDILISGSCDYPERLIQRFDTNATPDDVARALGPRAVAAYRRSGTDALTRPFLFCSGMGMADELGYKLNDYLLQEGIPPDEVGTVYKKVKKQKEEPSLYPIYKVGLAVNSVAERWRQILQQAVVSELFVNSRAVTARQYIDLLSMESSVEMIPLVSDLPADVADLFTRTFDHELDRRIDKLKSGHSVKPGAIEKLENLKRCSKENWSRKNG
jgi:hypothetical protein